MTQLKKPVRREVPNPNAARPSFIILIEPPVRDEAAIIKIKHKGRRKWYQTTIEAIFWMAVRQEADKLVAERKAKRLAKKARP